MIPVFEPQIGEAEIESVVAAMRRGEISGTYGRAVTDFESSFADYCNCKHAVATSSGTSALHLAVAAAGIGPGDEVLVSASTNIATALAVHHQGGVVVPVDSECETWNLDLSRIPSMITDRAKAIIPVHLYGHPVDMNRLRDIADRHDLVIIEDAAEAHGATCRGDKVGSFGDMACFSFYANKMITTGEGGMVTTDNEDLADRLRLLRNLAFGQPRFRHELAGHSFRMTGMQAAMGLVQLQKIESVIAEKRRVASCYRKHLAHIAGLQLPVEAAWARNVYWMYAVVVHAEFGATRDELAEALRADGIDTRTFFCPMNQQPCLGPGMRFFPCPIADRLWETGLYLPSSTNLSESTIRWICERVQRVSQTACRKRAA